MAAKAETNVEMHEHQEVASAGALDLVEKAINIDVQNDVRIRQKLSKEEKKLVRKTDFLILPLLSGSIFFAYLVSWQRYSNFTPPFRSC